MIDLDLRQLAEAKGQLQLEAGQAVLVRGIVTAVHPDGSVNVRFPCPSGEYPPEYALDGSVVEPDPAGSGGFVPAGLDKENPRSPKSLEGVDLKKEMEQWQR